MPFSSVRTTCRLRSGAPHSSQHPEFEALMARDSRRSARAAGVACGIHVVTPSPQDLQAAASCRLPLHRLWHRFSHSPPGSQSTAVTNNVKILVLIPARMGSSRFPGQTHGAAARRTDDRTRLPARRVESRAHGRRGRDLRRRDRRRTCAKIGGRVAMTGSHHERASDRCAEALEIIEREDGTRFDLVVMVQGDEPMVHPDMLSEAIAPMLADPADAHHQSARPDQRHARSSRTATASRSIIDRNSDALYFSREPIPTRSKGAYAPMGKQICVIPFRARIPARVHAHGADPDGDRRVRGHDARAREWAEGAHGADRSTIHRPWIPKLTGCASSAAARRPAAPQIFGKK